MAENTLQNESTIWTTADPLRGCGINKSDTYPEAFDSEMRWLLGMEAGDGKRFLDMRGVINHLKTKVVFSCQRECGKLGPQ
jgi:hypothetical protein